MSSLRLYVWAETITTLLGQGLSPADRAAGSNAQNPLAGSADGSKLPVWFGRGDTSAQGHLRFRHPNHRLGKSALPRAVFDNWPEGISRYLLKYHMC